MAFDPVAWAGKSTGGRPGASSTPSPPRSGPLRGRGGFTVPRGDFTAPPGMA
ncbi:hypothetical protein ACFQX4_17040 [Roseomonas sp. GCM10028921]